METRGPGRNLLISLLVVLCSTEVSVKKRDIDDRRAGLGSGVGGIGGGVKKGKSCGTGRAQLLVNYISSDDDECFSTRCIHVEVTGARKRHI